MSSRKDFVLGTSVTEHDMNMICTNSKLPSKENVLRCFLFLHKRFLNGALPGQHKHVDAQSANETVSLIKKVYEKAGIPTLHDLAIKHQILVLYKEYKALLKVKQIKRLSSYIQIISTY